MSTDYKQLIKSHILKDDTFIRATFSGRLSGRSIPWIRATIRPVLIKNEKQLQFSYFDARKDITKNYKRTEVEQKMDELLEYGFKNIHVETIEGTLQVNLTKKGNPLIHHTRASSKEQEIDLKHDRQKELILPANRPDAFLQAVGIMTKDGKIKADMQSKFRQINEFLKLLAETGELEKFDRFPLYIVDCGCGNAYLTFATYHYFNYVLGLPIQMVGIDVQAELLERHAERVQSLGWTNLTFEAKRIIDFEPSTRPDIVLALHACDTATDEAVAQGIKWGSKLIISAPCCHHDLQEQLDQQPCPLPFKPVSRYGILSERLGDILTDTFRALILRIMGYRADVVQFVSSEHTAKNLMIRGIKSVKPGDPKYVREYNELKNFWNVKPYLEYLLGEDFAAIISSHANSNEDSEQTELSKVES